MSADITICLVVGVPGSGKSTLCKRLVECFSGISSAVMDAVPQYIAFDAMYPPSGYIVSENNTPRFDPELYNICQQKFCDYLSDKVRQILKAEHRDNDKRPHHVLIVEDIFASEAHRKRYYEAICPQGCSGKAVHYVLLHCLPSAYIRRQKPPADAHLGPSDPLSDFAVILQRNAIRIGYEQLPHSKLVKVFQGFQLPMKRWERKMWFSVRLQRSNNLICQNEIDKAELSQIKSIEGLISRLLSQWYAVKPFAHRERFHHLHV